MAEKDLRYWRKRARAAEERLRRLSRMLFFIAVAIYIWLFRGELSALLGKGLAVNG